MQQCTRKLEQKANLALCLQKGDKMGASQEDNPTYVEAMNGPHRDGFHDAMKVELTVNTLNINVLLGCCRTFAFYECVS
jgi:hypothetical protein